MIRVKPAREPDRFEASCRQAGNRWLAANPGAPRPKPFWREFTGDLAGAFDERCGYAAILIQSGTVDHFRSWKRDPELAYEWSNYRYADGRVNSKKQTADGAVLDPFEVQDDWFEIILPSLQLRMTDRVPARLRARAAYTLSRLGLDHDERIVAYRAQWYCMYHCAGLTLEGLARAAPLIARAIRRDRITPDPALCGYGALAKGTWTRPPAPTRAGQPRDQRPPPAARRAARSRGKRPPT
jgi:hypothetical protein